LIDVNLKGTFREGLLALCSQLAKDVSGIYLLIAGEGAPHITVQRKSKEEKAPSLTSLKQLRLASLKLRFLCLLSLYLSMFECIEIRFFLKYKSFHHTDTHTR
jgi:hypothetical protein